MSFNHEREQTERENGDRGRGGLKGGMKQEIQRITDDVGER